MTYRRDAISTGNFDLTSDDLYLGAVLSASQPDHHQGSCSCSWRGPDRALQQRAALDVEDHMASAHGDPGDLGEPGGGV